MSSTARVEILRISRPWMGNIYCFEFRLQKHKAEILRAVSREQGTKSLVMLK